MGNIKYIHYSNYNNVIKEVCNFYGISIERFYVRTRKREVVKCRQICCYIFKRYTTESLKRIGEIISPDNPFDHTTVIHSNQSVLDEIDTNETYKNEVREIVELIHQFRREIFITSMAYRPKCIDAHSTQK